MKKLSGNEIRKTWLAFFKEKGHHVEKGASLIPYNDPTLLWINSGVAALKKYMDGSEVPPSRRITNVQKSIRTNDMDNVGYTSRHHTFFEMLGCFSIGDYFRKEIIEWAYEILTGERWFAMDKDKLYFTYNPIDLDTRDNWLKQGVSPDHLIALEGNYWQIGEGPCGPNTEVFYDRGEKYDPDHLGIKLLEEEIENDRYIEIWGIVFSQYNAQAGVDRKDYKELPSKNIDTGAGLERIASILQETDSNFETDLFMPLIKETEKHANVGYGEKTKTPYRVIADHIRSLTFAISDGASFSNEGRGYVLRRLLRRASRFAKKIGINEAFLYKLVDVVIDINKDFYPELATNSASIKKAIKIEEEKFLKTLSSGESLLREFISGKKVLSGKDAFKLYDTFGFPLELTKEICHEEGVEVDEKGFEEEMNAQKERARNARSDEQSMHRQSKDLLDFNLPSEFDYSGSNLIAHVIGVFKDGVKVDEITSEGEVIFDKTNFYAESGGQVSDKGEIRNSSTFAEVTEVIKAPNKEHLHTVKIMKGSIKVGDEFLLEINKEARELTKRNHSATHLLQSALNEVLGGDIKQMGSYVDSEYLRFDFTYPTKITEEELNSIEELVNKWISDSIQGDIEVLPIEEANKIGAKSFFSEKYGDYVRVVSFGDISKEFCGGTHVSNTLEIGSFVIESEESIASGVRRIVARSSLNAYKLVKERLAILDNVAKTLGSKSIYEIDKKLASTLANEAKSKHENSVLLDKLAHQVASGLLSKFESVNGYELLIAKLDENDLSFLNKIGDDLKSVKTNSLIVLLGVKDEVSISVMVNGEALTKGNKAGDLVKLIATHLGGSGGGRPNMANGRGKDTSKVDEAIELVKKNIK